jgi:MFS family permease
MPIGRISDRMDRRYVLAATGFGAALFGLAVFLFQPRTGSHVIPMTACYGALAYTLYSIAVAHANDHARGEEFVKISGGLLLLYGFGTMLGPVIGAGLMGVMRPESLFLATALAHACLASYTLLRIRRRAAVPVEDREAFQTLPADRAVTPEAGRLDPRVQDNIES